MATQVRRVRRKRRHVQHVSYAKSRVAAYVAAALIGLALGWAFSSYAPRAYAGWRESRLQKRASAMLQEGDLPGATAAARRMLEVRPNSLAAFQILADATEKQNLPETVAWRAQIARVLRDNLDAQLNLASAALRFGQIDLASRALDNVAAEDRDKPAYHVVAGWLARAQGNEGGVEEHFAAAVRQEPANDLYQFNLGVLQIRSPDPEKYANAREQLERLSKVQGFRTGSIRALLNDALQRGDLERADRLAQDIQMTQQVTFGDLLLCLEFYHKLDEKKFAALLEKVKPIAARNRQDVASLVEWLNKAGLAPEALKWTDKLAPELTTSPPAAVAIAEAFAEQKNWSRLKRWTRSGSWGDSEFLRLAYQSYAARNARQSGGDAEADALWHSADKLTVDHPEQEATLARLGVRWSLTNEAKALWRRVAKYPPMRREALDALSRIARVANDLPELLQIAKQLHEASPRETALTANYARLALLLSPNTEDAQRAAKEAYDAAPSDLNCAIAYAFSLYTVGRTSEGLEVLQKPPKEELHEPHAALYMAVLLLDDNKPEAAQPFVEAAQRGPLYIEEKKLLDEALAKMNVPPPAPAPTAEPPNAPPEAQPSSAPSPH